MFLDGQREWLGGSGFWRTAALATVRFESPPGKQLQADFGQCLVSIGGERERFVHNVCCVECLD